MQHNSNCEQFAAALTGDEAKTAALNAELEIVRCPCTVELVACGAKQGCRPTDAAIEQCVADKESGVCLSMVLLLLLLLLLLSMMMMTCG
jgi:hypothetical protein